MELCEDREEVGKGRSHSETLAVLSRLGPWPESPGCAVFPAAGHERASQILLQDAVNSKWEPVGDVAHIPTSEGCCCEDERS